MIETHWSCLTFSCWKWNRRKRGDWEVIDWKKRVWNKSRNSKGRQGGGESQMVATMSGSNEKTLAFLGGKSSCKAVSAMKVFCFHSPTPLSVFNCYQDVVYQTEEVVKCFFILYTPTSVFIFSILFSACLLRCWQGKCSCRSFPLFSWH